MSTPRSPPPAGPPPTRSRAAVAAAAAATSFADQPRPHLLRRPSTRCTRTPIPASPQHARPNTHSNHTIETTTMSQVNFGHPCIPRPIPTHAPPTNSILPHTIQPGTKHSPITPHCFNIASQHCFISPHISTSIPQTTPQSPTLNIHYFTHETSHTQIPHKA